MDKMGGEWWNAQVVTSQGTKRTVFVCWQGALGAAAVGPVAGPLLETGWGFGVAN
jgi:hypothetical protein